MNIKRRLIWATVIMLTLWIGVYAITGTPLTENSTAQPSTPTQTPDFANAAYNVGGLNYVLKNGFAAAPMSAPGASAQGTLRVYQATRGNLQGNGGQDAAAILISEPGGSGTFYYLTAFFANGSTTPAVLLGDRIETDSVVINNGTIVITYKDRAAGQPFSSAPTVSKTVTYRVVNNALIQQ